MTQKKTKKKLNSQEDLLEWHCPKHEGVENCMDECHVQRILCLFGKKYSMQIIRILLKFEKLRFNEIEEKLGGSPKTITSRLRELEEHGLIKRKVFNEVPIRVEYSLTKHSEALEDIFERIAIWAVNLKNRQNAP
ncbi:MAG: Transcriptional regulator, HxlR family [Promethearchaeota archaeon]|nr:MAG: Transcriptional regulator, HxlR family [Candidatus Lokiarchaeota archaeon]